MPDGIDYATKAVADAKKALAAANNSSVGTKSGHSNFTPKQQAASTAYSHARAARKNPDEFMGVRSDESNDINTALAAREQAKKALNQ